MHRWHRADPGIALNKRRNRQRGNRQCRPDLPPCQGRAFSQPRDRHAERNARRDGQGTEPQRIAEQLPDARTEHQRLNGLPSGINPHGNDKTRREEC